MFNIITIQEMKIKTTMGHHHIPIRMAKIKKKSSAVFYKVTIHLPYDPAIPFLPTLEKCKFMFTQKPVHGYLYQFST